MKKYIVKILSVCIMFLVIPSIGHTQTGVHITINPSPTLYSVTGGGTYCAGLSGMPVGLSGSEVGVNYQLQVNGTNTGMPLPGTGAPLNFGNQLVPGVYTVIATNTTTGCSIQMSNSAIITVNPIPAITLTASGPVEFCGSGTVTLTANTGTGHTYQWYKNGVIIPGANLNQYVANSTGVYKVVATNTSTGCSNNRDTMVMVHPLPQQFTVTANSSNFCQGSQGVTINLNGSQTNVSYQLMLNGSASGVPIAGTGYSLSWPNQAVAGTYTVIATDNISGCTQTMIGSSVVTMDPLPATAGMISGPTSVCQNATVTFTTTNIANATDYAWSVPNGATIVSGQGTTQITVNFAGSTGGLVSVFGQNACGGGQPSSITVTVNLAPTLNVTANPSDICAGNSTMLTAGGSGTSFVWSTGQTTQNFSASPVVTTTYTVTATGSNGCTATGNITVNVHPLPTVTLNLTQDNFCTDVNSAVLSGGSPIGGTYSGSCVFGGNTIYPPISGPGTYIVTYTYTDQNGCSNAATDLLTINPIPVVMFTNVVGNIKVDTPPFDLMGYVSPTGGTFTGPGIVSGSSIFDPAAAGVGTHMITYTYTHPITGCGASQIQYINVGSVGIDEVTAAVNNISLYPNPAKQILYLTGIATDELKSLRIVDMVGKVVYTAQINADNMQIDVSGLTSGTYIISFIDAEGFSLGKWFIKTE